MNPSVDLYHVDQPSGSDGILTKPTVCRTASANVNKVVLASIDRRVILLASSREFHKHLNDVHWCKPASARMVQASGHQPADVQSLRNGTELQNRQVLKLLLVPKLCNTQVWSNTTVS